MGEHTAHKLIAQLRFHFNQLSKTFPKPIRSLSKTCPTYPNPIQRLSKDDQASIKNLLKTFPEPIQGQSKAYPRPIQNLMCEPLYFYDEENML